VGIFIRGVTLLYKVRRRSPTALGLSLTAAIIGALLVPSGQVLADPDGRCLPCSACDPCRPTHDLIQFQSYYASLAAQVNGTVLSAGEFIELPLGKPVPVVLLTNVPADFLGWVSNIGTFANNFSASTTFTASVDPGTGTLEAVSNASNVTDSNIWGGYVNTPITTSGYPEVFSCTSASVWFPEVSDPSGQGAGQLDEMSLWVGIGGIEGNSSLWQAGVEIWQTTSASGGSTVFNYFAEGATPAHPETFYETSSQTSNLPTKVSMNVCAPKTGIDTWSIGGWYSSTGQTTWYNGSTQSYSKPPFYANLSASDWVAEDASTGTGNSRYVMPAFDELTFYDLSWTTYQNGTATGLIGGTGVMMLISTGCSCGTEYGIPTSISPQDPSTQFGLEDPGDPNT